MGRWREGLNSSSEFEGVNGMPSGLEDNEDVGESH
jgi:hypothetical protein